MVTNITITQVTSQYFTVLKCYTHKNYYVFFLISLAIKCFITVLYFILVD